MGFIRRITSLVEPAKATISFAEAEQAMLLKQLMDDQGAFAYDEEGFLFSHAGIQERVNWGDIDRITVYKQGQFTHEEICLDLFMGEYKWTFTESTPGWYCFLNRMRAVFSIIPEGWEEKMAKQPFATNHLVLFER